MDQAFWSKLGLDLVNVMVPVLMTALPIVLTALFGLMVQQIRLLQAKIQQENPTAYSKLESLCTNAVLIAEQMKLGGYIDDKKKWAVEYVQGEVNKLGLIVDVSKIEEEIEKAVYLSITSAAKG